MKKLIFPLVILLLFSFSKDSGTNLDKNDREWIMKHLTETREHMKQVLDGLSDEQLDYKPDPTSWSIAENVEHLALTEKMFVETLHKSVAEGPKPELKDSLVFKDDQIMPMIADRSQKVKTAEPFEPSGQYGSTEETLAALLAIRQELMDYVENTDDDLRNRYATLPFGTVDAAQLIVFIAGHMERHVLQMEEVMEDEDFPEM
ncbi:DinB family protein [Muricauda oceani]|uniref:DinB family protein n=1 Tax=Flagellimonas oceani TaxID=2698672 RepID=A0A6G7J5M4_9FLAO|nr:DinB family protein [Allomuricauda oceani]MBW8242339.1 DinB family protein [Allomuricauda oceani]QII46096.1 DinB family protein [Allomuricauda oceani]